jgi:hypothetical protein
MFVFGFHVFENVKRIGRVKISGNRTLQHIMDTRFERPIRIHPLDSVGDE